MPNEISDPWFADFQNVMVLAHALEMQGCFPNVRAAIRYFEKPWKWTLEWEAYQAGKLAEFLENGGKS